MPSLSLFSLLVLAALASCQEPEPIVRISTGILQGSWKASSKGRPYASFQGVPYARPPVGKYRFREPQYMKPWQGKWDASKPLSQCLQYEPFLKDIVGSEDCLYVNVASPKPYAGANLPVVVFIHGGAFMFGTGHIYEADLLMDKDVVLVTLNYRLGPLGFLSTGDEHVPGNFGLKDQSFALQWIRDNIMMFGGNPNSVTLTGCSAGGASVHYQYLSPMSKGLFHRGIAFSGAAYASWTHATKPLQKAKTLAEIVGCPNTDLREMTDCLRYRPAEVIVRAQLEMFEWRVHMFTPFRPTTEGHQVRDAFLRQYPYQASQSGAEHRVPLLTTVTSEEGLYPAAAYQTESDILPELDAKWEALASLIFEYNDTLPASRRSEVAQRIKQRYLGGRPVSQETFAQLVQALGDRLFVADVGRLAQMHALKSGQPVYVYRYAFRGDFSLSNLMAGNKNNYGVSHADDVFHIFPYHVLGPLAEKDLQMSDVLLDIVYNYASTGVPSLSKSPVSWLPVTPGSAELNYLEITSPTKMEMKSSTDFGQKSFWDSLGFLENDKYAPYRKDEL